MVVCQICGDKGYSRLLIHCAQCPDVAVHRYCILNPSIAGDEKNMSCEFCDSGTTKPTTASYDSEGLSTSVEPLSQQKNARKKLKNNLIPLQSEKADDALNGTAERATISNQKNKEGSSRRKQAKPKEKGSIDLLHVAEDPKNQTDIGKGKGDDGEKNNGASDLSVLNQKDKKQSVGRKQAKPKENASRVTEAAGIGKSDDLCEINNVADDHSVLDEKAKKASVKRKQAKLKKDGSPALPHAIETPKGMFSISIAKGGDLCENNKRATYHVVIALENEKESVRGKQVQPKENGNSDLLHATEAPQILSEIGKGGNSSNDVNKCQQKSPQGEKHSGKLKRPADAKKGKEIKDSIADNAVKQECFLSAHVAEQKIKNVDLSDAKVLPTNSDEGKADTSYNDINGCQQRTCPTVAKKRRDVKDPVSYNVVKEGRNVSSQVTKQKNKNVNSSVTSGRQLAKMRENAGCVSSELEDVNKSSTCTSGDSIHGNSKLVTQQKLASSSLLKKKIHNKKPSCDVNECQQKSPQGNKGPGNLKCSSNANKGKEIKVLIPDTVVKEGCSVSSPVTKPKIQNVDLCDAKVDTDIGKGDNSCNNVNGCPPKSSQSTGHLKCPAAAKKGKEIKDSMSENVLKEGRNASSQVTEPKIKNVNSSDTIGRQLAKNRAPHLLSEVDDIDNRSTCLTENGNHEDSKLAKQRKLMGVSLPDQKFRKSSCEVSSIQLEESQISKNKTRNADLAGNVDTRKTGVKETAVVVSHVQSDCDCDVSKCQAPRKKRKYVIEMEYSDEDPVFVVAKQPCRLAEDAIIPSNKSCSEAVSKVSDDCVARLSSVESARTRRSPKNVDGRVLTQEPSVVFDNSISNQPSPTKLVGHICAEPLTDVAWRGYCSIADKGYTTSLVMEAHLSNKAHENVLGALNLLPELLNFNLVPKEYAWPKSFEESPPTSDTIGLYFFPVEWTEKAYDSLLRKMIALDLVLKSVIDNLELLVFCSLELPHEEWSLQRKYYLWGVFKPRTDPIMPNNHRNHGIPDVELPRDSYHRHMDPLNPFSYTHYREEPMVEIAYEDRHYRAFDRRNHGIHHRRSPREFWEPQDYEHLSEADYEERGRSYQGPRDRCYEHPRRWRFRDRDRDRDRDYSGQSRRFYRSRDRRYEQI